MGFCSIVVFACLAASLPSAQPTPIPSTPFDISTRYVDVEEKQMEITVVSSSGGYIGIGISEDGSMNSGGKGSDVFVCDKSGLKRYWVTQLGRPTDGANVPGSMCTRKDGMSKMRFTRSVNATNSKEISIAPGKDQFLIWATDKGFKLKFHGTNAGYVKFDFASHWLILCIVLSEFEEG